MHTAPQAPSALPARAYAWTFAVCAAATLLAAAVFWHYRDTNVWHGFQEARAFKAPGPSERIFVDSVFRTRANTWSNLAYAYVGIAALVVAAYDLRRRPTANYLCATPALSAFFGLSCVYLGVGSGVFHASLTRWGQQLDVAAMYSTLVALLAINFGRVCPRIAGVPSWPLWIALAVVVDVLFYVYKWSLSSGVVLPALILGVMAFGTWDCLASRNIVPVRWLFIAVLTLVVAVACRGLDLVPPLDSPEIWLKGHALWHGFTAASLGCMYAYFRAERPRPKS